MMQIRALIAQKVEPKTEGRELPIAAEPPLMNRIANSVSDPAELGATTWDGP